MTFAERHGYENEAYYIPEIRGIVAYKRRNEQPLVPDSAFAPTSVVLAGVVSALGYQDNAISVNMTTVFKIRNENMPLI